ncbi:MAG: tetratricopeptide repeat protein, partial [Halieaceae bacterium]
MGHARHMLAEDPRRAIIQLDEVLLVVPDYPPALLLKATAINRIDGPEASLELLAPLAEKHGQWPAVHFEYAKILSVLKHGEAAIRALETVVALEPEHPEAWRMLADHLAAVGEQERSESAYLKHLRCST